MSQSQERRPVSATRRPLWMLQQMYGGRKSHNAAMTTISRLHQPLHQLALLKDRSIIQAEGLHPVPQRAAGVAVQHIGPILFIHRHHLALHAVWPWHRLPEMPGAPVVVTVKAERVGRGQAELAETLPAVNVVSIGRDQQASRLELYAVAWAECKGGPFCTSKRKRHEDLEGLGGNSHYIVTKQKNPSICRAWLP